MCSHYQAVKDTERIERYFGVKPPITGELAIKSDMWPSYLGSFIRANSHASVGDQAVPRTEHLLGLFGLVPHWADSTKLTRSTYNARSETAAEKPTFRDAWKKAQHCIIPAEAIYEPDWRTGKAVSARIGFSDGTPMGIAGLYSNWKNDQGALIHSFTMLTVNADEHPFMSQFHKPTDEKRMVVILPEDSYQSWLDAKEGKSMHFMRAYSGANLVILPQMANSRS